MLSSEQNSFLSSLKSTGSRTLAELLRVRKSKCKILRLGHAIRKLEINAKLAVLLLKFLLVLHVVIRVFVVLLNLMLISKHLHTF